MSTCGLMRVRGTGAGAIPSSATYIYVAGTPRRVRQRRRAILLLAASLAVLMPVGFQIHRAATATATATPTAATAVPREQGIETFTNGAEQAKQPPEAEGIDPSLSRALAKAQIAARAAGLQLQVTSGARSAATQQQLYDQAIVKYGSTQEARRWVLPPAESAHVKGLAVDLGPREAAAWLERHGVRYGLCRRYVNEWWHFERLAPAIGQPCPALEPYAGG